MPTPSAIVALTAAISGPIALVAWQEGPVSEDGPAVESRAASELPATVRITRESTAATLAPSARQFEVAVRLVSGDFDCKLPTIAVRDGEQVTMADTSTDAIVVAERTVDDRREPIVRQVDLGTTIQVTVVGVDDERVAVDCTLTLQGAAAYAPQELRGKRFSGVRGQIVECVRLGQPVVCQLGPSQDRFDITVKAAAEQPR